MFDVIFMLFMLNINHYQDFHTTCEGSSSKGQVVAITGIVLSDYLSCKNLVKYAGGSFSFTMYEKFFSSHAVRVNEGNHN